MDLPAAKGTLRPDAGPRRRARPRTHLLFASPLPSSFSELSTPGPKARRRASFTPFPVEWIRGL